MLGWVVKMVRTPPPDPEAALAGRIAILIHTGQMADIEPRDWPIRWADGLSREVDEANNWIDEVLGPEITRGTPSEQDVEPPAPAP
jgi:hypothetical protein